MLSIKTANVIQNGEIIQQADMVGSNEDVASLPTDYAIGSTFFNTDTGEVLMFNGTGWSKL